MCPPRRHPDSVPFAAAHLRAKKTETNKELAAALGEMVLRVQVLVASEPSDRAARTTRCH